MKVPLMRWNDFKYDKLIFPAWADIIVDQWHEHNFEERVKKLAATTIHFLSEQNYELFTDKTAFKNFFPQHWDISEYMHDSKFDIDTLVKSFWDMCDKAEINYQNWEDEQIDEFDLERLKEHKEEMTKHDLIRTNLLLEQDFSFAFPPYKNMFCMIGNPVNENQSDEIKENTQLACLIMTMTEEVANGDSVISNFWDKRKIPEGGTLLVMSTFSKSGGTQPGLYSYSLESINFVALDINGRPVNYSTSRHNLEASQELVRNHKLFFSDNSFNENNLVQLLQMQSEAESLYTFTRTCMILELFQIINTKPTSDIKIFNEELDKSAGKREYKKAKKKGYTGPADAFIFKTLKINPNLTVPKKDGKGRERLTYGNLKEHSRRGHRKVYTADKPRLGINHPNHIGAFWYKESIVGDIREGIVEKDYKVSSEEE